MLMQVTSSEISLSNLFTTPPADLPFMRDVVVRSFLITGENGTLAIYNAPGLSESATMEGGAPKTLLMSHWHEEMYGPPDLDLTPYVAAADRAETARSLPNVRTFDAYQDSRADIDIIPTPGHTAGSVMFLWTSGDHRVLFCGDSIWNHDGRWEAVVLGESKRQNYIASLEAIAELDFDVLIPWVAKRGAPCVNVCDRHTARTNILQIAHRLRRGERA
ncbi:MBL fold metallo-hydrolase [Martelella endophytica]|uniref:MBL fold metallo-hydrolase n=1 Tax=Martelella endophytica TaxID=1486262 RepID=UPI0009E5CDC9|nr:MBL fold metallo-hydrolase [Martelella endophytica]